MPGGVDRLALGAGLTPIGAFNPLSARGLTVAPRGCAIEQGKGLGKPVGGGSWR